MGTVRLTEKRKDTYVRRAEEMFQKANDFPEFTPEETTKIMGAFTNHPLQQATRQFINEQHTLYNVDEDRHLPFNITVGTDTVSRMPCFLSKGEEKSTPCNFPTEVTLYGTDRSYYFTAQMEYWAFIPDQFFSDPREILMMQSAIRRVMDERQAHKDAHSKFMSGVKDALGNCNTLGQLIKLWPAAENLASEEDMRKLHTKETRAQTAKRVREEIDLDVSALNTTVLTANLVGD